MPRIRTVKPEIALHEGLYELEAETGLPIRFSWCMLFCHCDREGRFEWRPRRLGTQILPYDGIDFARVLDAWATRGFVRCYRVGDRWIGEIPTFRRHQVINNRESDSELPPSSQAEEWYEGIATPKLECIQENTDAQGTRAARENGAQTTGEARKYEAEKRNGREQGTEGNKEQGTGVKHYAHSGNGHGARFPEFWAIWPRKRDKQKARQVWISKRLDEKADEILHDVRERQRRDWQWLKNSGEFIPHPTTYLRNARWEDEFRPPPSGPSGGDPLDGWGDSPLGGPDHA